MHQIEEITEHIRQSFDARTAARDRALAQTRLLTRHCANAIRAIHRDETIAGKRTSGRSARAGNDPQDQSGGISRPVICRLYAGCFQGICRSPAVLCPGPGSGPAPAGRAGSGTMPPTCKGWRKPLASCAGAAWTNCARGQGSSAEAERLLSLMDEIFTVLVTMDYPDAVTGGLRRLTDIARCCYRTNARRPDHQPAPGTPGKRIAPPGG